MATAEALRFSPEQQQAYRQIAGFFGRAESDFPVAAKQLVNVVGGLVGEQQTTQKDLQAGMGNIDVGLALIGDWLKETGVEGFDVKLGLGGGAKKAIGRSKVNFPTGWDLIRVGGRVNSELATQIPPLLSSFSRQIRGGLDVGLSPRQIVGGLLAESVGSRLSVDGSANLREALNKPLGGHFEWIRQALGIPDAAGQPGFRAAEISPAEKEASEKPAVVMIGEGKAETETDLTLEEKAFMDTLKGLVGMEKSTGTFEAKGLQQFEARELQKYFQDMRLYFYGLPEAGQLRAEVMKGVFGQLGAEWEKLRKAGKKDGEIFDEWLKRVFIPFYRRTKKKP